MPQACAAFGCSNRRTADNRHRGITYHKFPKDPSLRRAWLMAVRRKGFQPSDKTVICSRHFTESDFDRTGQTVRLRERVIPSVFGSFPDQLKKVPSKARSTKTSKHAGEPSRRLALVSERPEPMKAPTSDHHYALDPDQVKCKIAEAQARVEDLQRQLRNALDRERRQKQTIKMLLDDLKEKNVIIPEHAAGSHVKRANPQHAEDHGVLGCADSEPLCGGMHCVCGKRPGTLHCSRIATSNRSIC